MTDKRIEVTALCQKHDFTATSEYTEDADYKTTGYMPIFARDHLAKYPKCKGIEYTTESSEDSATRRAAEDEAARQQALQGMADHRKRQQERIEAEKSNQAEHYLRAQARLRRSGGRHN